MSWRSHEERVGKGKMCPKSDIVRYLGHAPNYKDSYLCYNPANLSVKVRHGVHWIRPNHVLDSVIEGVRESTNKVISRSSLPSSLREALDGPDRDRWLEALHKEINECVQRGTFRLADQDKKKQSMKSKIVLDIKDDGNYKCRWVACGYGQQAGRDYNSTFSPTISFKSLLTLQHIAAINDYEITIVDIGNAFQETKLDLPIYMSIPDDIRQVMGYNIDCVGILGGLYGLKQAGLLWYILISIILIDFGLEKSLFDQ